MTRSLCFPSPTVFFFAAMFVAGCEPGSAEQGTAEQVAFFEASEIEAVEISEVPPEDCTEHTADAVCAACTGTKKNFTARRVVTQTSTISNKDCIGKLDALFDNYCVQQNIPADCAGDCPGAKLCKPAGQAISTGTNLDVTSGVITCEGKTYLCSCKCR